MSPPHQRGPVKRQASPTTERRIEALASSLLRYEENDGGARALEAELASFERWLVSSAEMCLELLKASREALITSSSGDAASRTDAFERASSAITTVQELLVEGREPSSIERSNRAGCEREAAVTVEHVVAPVSEGAETGGGFDDFAMLDVAEIEGIDFDLLPVYLAEAGEQLEQAELLLVKIESEPEEPEHLNGLFRAMHTIKGSSAVVGLARVKELAHESEQLLDSARRGAVVLTGDLADLVLAAIDELRRLVDCARSVEKDGPEPEPSADPALLRRLRAAVASAGATRATPRASAEPLVLSSFDGDARSEVIEGSDPPVASTEDIGSWSLGQPTNNSSSTEVGRANVAPRDSVRVDSERLDKLVEMIGELVIAESMVSHSPDLRTSAIFPRLARQVGQMDKLSRALQEHAMSLRMVPVRDTFQRTRRVVRDVAKRAGKEVSLVLEGESIELDKTVVDLLGDPLMHLVRNAIDHGLESPEERLAAGKPREGKLEIRAKYVGDQVHIEVRDDGRGLDTERIVEKAVERGLVAPGQTLTEAQIFGLIFAPGLSTAKVVTDLSGRGVGTDVVRSAIESLRGRVEVLSTRGQGATFRLRLPLTLAAIDGMLVLVGGRRYIVPTLSIVRTVQRDSARITELLNGSRAIQLNGKWVPVYSLRQTLDPSVVEDSGALPLVVVVENGEERAGFAVERLLGQQQIVVKSIGAAISVPGIAGGAILPDGTVGLVLELGGLMALAREGFGASGNGALRAA
jgi:two-component system chemotaxis sensor kinase CheA